MASEPTALMDALDFTPDDLAANREGRLSERQKERLRGARRRAMMVSAVIIVILVLAATVLLFLGQQNNNGILSLVGILVTVCNAAIVGVAARNWLRLGADIESGSVTVLNGEVRHTIRVTGRIATYVLRVNDTELNVPKPVFLAIRDGARYRLYRSAAAKVLLSGEAGEKKMLDVSIGLTPSDA